MRQQRLSLTQPGPQSFDAYVRGSSNAAAAAAVEAWPNWLTGALSLVGPEGSGKSHLAAAWAKRAGAARLDRANPDLATTAAVLIEDADRGVADEALFHLINLAGRGETTLLLTARTLPGAWSAALPDLRSRLNAMPVAQIDPPDDEVLEGLLRRFFRERNIRPPEAVYRYLLTRMERSVVDARDVVRRLDEAGQDGFKPVTRVLARQILDGDNENIELFE